MSKVFVRELQNSLLLVIAVLSAGMGLKGFLLSSNFIDGGVTGVSQLLSKISNVPLSIWIPLVNLPFIALGYRVLGFKFALRSLLAIGGLSAAIAFIPYPNVTQDFVLTAIFGGLFIGAGIGLAVRGGAVLDGTEVVALLISRSNKMFKVGDVILGFNIIIFFVAIFILGVEPALYSILTYVSAAQTLNFVIYGLEEFTAITIVTTAGPSITSRITSSSGRGVTLINGTSGTSGEAKNILYCVVTRLEIEKVKSIARELDPSAFITIHPLVDVEGGNVVKRWG